MKTLLVLSFLLCSADSVLGQVSDTELNEFWNSRVIAIIELDRNLIDEFLADPPGGEWGLVIGLTSAREDWTKADFLDRLEDVFSRELRAYLKKSDVSVIEIWRGQNGEELVLTFREAVNLDGDLIESTTFIVFSKVNDKWMLSRMIYGG